MPRSPLPGVSLAVGRQCGTCSAPDSASIQITAYKRTLLPLGSPALGKLRDEVAAHFQELSLAEQQEMLDFRWEKIASPSMLPVLRRIYEHPSSDQGRPSLTELALRRIYELSPREGRNLILKEIASGHPRAGADVLGLLQEKELPELDGELAENLENSVGSNQLEIFLRLIARYASPAIFPRVEAATEDRIGDMPCAAEWALLDYTFRADPDSAVRLLEKALDSRQYTKCYTMDLSEVAKAHMNPQVERVALARLNDPDPEVAASAAATLGRYGTAAAEQALWQRFQKWHSTWQGREDRLPDQIAGDVPNASQVGLEMALLESLAQGQAWFAGEQELQRLKALCISRYARQHADELIGQQSSEPHIVVSVFDKASYQITVAQYQLDSMASLKRKVAQFPEGTVFTLEVNDSDSTASSRIAAEVKSFLEEHGMKLGT